MKEFISEVEVHNAADKDIQLTIALGNAIRVAQEDSTCGVLVTRHQYTKFTVSLSPTVPYGQTRELDLVHSPTSHRAAAALHL